MANRPAHVLIVEDDAMVQGLLAEFLRASGYHVTAAGNAAGMWAVIARERIDIVLLDLGLPDEDGIAVARQFRASHSTPLVIMTARTGRDDRLAALSIGADDYLTKPFDPREMILRIENLLARAQGGTAERVADVIAFAGFRLDLGSHTLTGGDGAAIVLTPAEYSLLAALARAPNRVLSRGQLLDAMSHGGDAPGQRVVDVVVGRLRKKLGDDPKASQLIITVPGFGYLFRRAP